jgi:adenine-specific DNA-methyltransferase
VDWEVNGEENSGISAVTQSNGSYPDRMLEVLRKSPVLHIGGGKKVVLRNVRRPAKTLSLSAEAMVALKESGVSRSYDETLRVADADNADVIRLGQPVAIVFGPENGAISEKQVFEAVREAHAKNYVT